MVGKRKKSLHKDFWMEIRKNKARFISIFCIVALGVAFFSGIQAASPDMRYSGDAYYNQSKLMDLKVVSTMGLTETAEHLCSKCAHYAEEWAPVADKLWEERNKAKAEKAAQA